VNARLTIWLWAAGDLIRHPYQAILTGAALASVFLFAAVPLLLYRGITDLATEILQEGPSVVARRISGGQWAPMPIAEALEAATSTPGVVSARPRIQGVVAGPQGAVTVVAVCFDGDDESSAAPGGFASPKPGEAIVGPGVLASEENHKDAPAVLILRGETAVSLKPAGFFDDKHASAVHDVVFVHQYDARRLLGLAPGYAVDLAIRVFHEQEAEAVIPDLADAFPWPSRMTTRTETSKAYTASVARRGGLYYLVLAPCILALALIVAAGFRGAGRGAYESGLLKSLGWTTPDIVGLFILKALLIAVPSVAAGAALSFFLVHWPGIEWPGFLFFGWERTPPGLHLEPSGSLPVLALTATAVSVPYLAANLWPALRYASADPYELLRREGGR
jgi:hypothetical protein